MSGRQRAGVLMLVQVDDELCAAGAERQPRAAGRESEHLPTLALGHALQRPPEVLDNLHLRAVSALAQWGVQGAQRGLVGIQA